MDGKECDGIGEQKQQFFFLCSIWSISIKEQKRWSCVFITSFAVIHITHMYTHFISFRYTLLYVAVCPHTYSTSNYLLNVDACFMKCENITQSTCTHQLVIRSLIPVILSDSIWLRIDQVRERRGKKHDKR